MDMAAIAVKSAAAESCAYVHDTHMILSLSPVCIDYHHYHPL